MSISINIPVRCPSCEAEERRIVVIELPHSGATEVGECENCGGEYVVRVVPEYKISIVKLEFPEPRP